MNNRLILGIDPGLKGYFAFCNIDTKQITAAPIPTYYNKQKKRDEYNIAEIVELMTPDIIFAVAEEQMPMPKQGVASTFRTGYGYGLLLGILSGKGIKYDTVSAKKWKKELIDDTPQDGVIQNNVVKVSHIKEKSIAEVKRLFPEADLRRTKRSRISDHNKAEALLICEYGRRLAETAAASAVRKPENIRAESAGWKHNISQGGAK